MQYKIPVIKIRMVRERPTVRLNGPHDAKSAVRKLCCGENPSVESFCVLYLDAQNQIISGRVVATGSVSQAALMPREVFQCACDAGASAVIVGHNHPSGRAEPSQEDREMTRRLVAAGEVLNIPVVDHIIATEHGEGYSFAEKGDMER